MGLLSSVGKALNSVTGATSAAAQNQKYALQSAQVNNAYQKEFAKNAHQWEVEDLKNAGLNPVLSANGGASASGGGVNSASLASSGINPIETAIGAWNGYEQARNTGADTDRKNAEIDNINADTLLKGYQQMTEIAKAGATKAERDLAQAKAQEILKTLSANIDKIKAETRLIDKQKKKLTTVKEGHGEAGISLGILGKLGVYGSGGSTN